VVASINTSGLALGLTSGVTTITATSGSISGYASLTVESPPPPLGISTYSSQPAVFFPTATGTNYTLMMTTNLATGPWVPVTNGVSISGVVITNPPNAAFFKLQ
jgi:hypothetical protein